MKFVVSLIFTVLVCARPSKPDVSSIEDLCSIKASVFSINPSSGNRLPIEVLLSTESSVTACKEMSGANVFRTIYLRSESSRSQESQLKAGSTVLSNIDLFYGHESLKFYDGFEFNIEYINGTLVDRFLQERSSGQKFSLYMKLDKWSEFGAVIRESAAKIHHIVLVVDDNEKSLETFKEVLDRNPELAFSVRISSNKMKAKEEAKKLTTPSRKVGYTVYLSNPVGASLFYTAGI